MFGLRSFLFANGFTTIKDECAEEDIDWNKIPVGWHPANEEEAVARIEAIEAEYENGQYIDAEDFERELIAQYPWLA